MEIGDSCVFNVFANCTWPVIEVNSVDVELYVNTFKGDITNDTSKTFKAASKEKNKIISSPPAEFQKKDC